MTAPEYLAELATYGGSDKKLFSTLVDILVALNQPTTSEYEWTDADELMYLASLVDLSPQIQETYNSTLNKYAEYLERREDLEPIPLPDTVNVSGFLVFHTNKILSEPLPVEDIPKAVFILSALAEVFLSCESILSSTNLPSIILQKFFQ